MARHNQLGIKGEDVAVSYLKENKIEVLHRNWRFGNDEIDIVAKDGIDLIIVEVKTRSTDYFGDPAEAVDEKKQSFLIRAAESLITNEGYDMNIRYDIISVIVHGNKTTIRHIKDAFYPE